ncbi:MAG: Bax inhibitor-1/YccA family protein [Lactobacillus sp.]|nr:Bax inhibitor-1/YccA family protein [Lactobacillus sp.]
MDNFSPNPERKHVQDISAVNSFLTKMYSLMVLAVLISAATAYITTTLFSNALATMPQAVYWIVVIVPIFLCLGISFKAAANPGLGFVLLMILSVVYGFEFSFIAGAFTSAQIGGAFVSAAAIFAAMALFGTFTKRDLTNWGSYLGAATIGFLVAWLVNLFLHSAAVTYIFSFIGVIIFTLWIAYDAHSAKRIYSSYNGQVSDSSLAIMGALNLYLDFINIFMFLLQIFGMSSDR